ncbi:ABC transporter ATP-binding protein [Bacillus sp. FSL W7-1360]
MATETFPLVVEKVNKHLGSTHVIKDMSFSLERGMIYGFLGPNGSGKTTTIRMIVSLIAPNSGEVYIEGSSIKTEREKALKHIGAIVENPDLYLYLTGMQNLRQFAQMSAERISEERFEEVIRLVELEHAIHKKVKKYSLGMKQRLGIAVSILHRPSVLILDEPTNGLDPKGIRDLRDYLRKLARDEGVTLLVSSHQLNEIEVLCDRAIVINDGTVVDELHMGTNKQSHEQMTITIEAEPVEKAATLLQPLGATKQTERGLEIEGQLYDAIPQLVRTLTENDVSIYAISYQKRLEDAYFSLTEEKRGNAT